MKTIIISPSGNFYGSEQVLFDHLKYTSNKFLVFLPKDSKFESKVKSLNKHMIKNFNSIYLLYLNLFYILFIKKIKFIYLNEAGHIKYIKFLSFFFSNVNFIIHIRLKEDTSYNRIGEIRYPNIKLICISNYIFNLTNRPNKSVLIYDPILIESSHIKTSNDNSKIVVGFIGRITTSKGLKFIDDLLSKLLNHPLFEKIVINFYGDVDYHLKPVNIFYNKFGNLKYSNIIFHGFINDQNLIYDRVDAVLHLNPEEPLGRIGLESWSRDVPFFCFDSGGCFEINSLLDQAWFILPKSPGWENLLISKLLIFKKLDLDFVDIRFKLSKKFSINSYIKNVESLICE